MKLFRGLRGLEAYISENMSLRDLFFLKKEGKERSWL